MIIFLLIGMQYGIANAQVQKIKYQLQPNGYSFSIHPQWRNEIKMPRMSHRSYIDSVHYDEYFNRAIRRDNSILVTGDKPVFALMKYLKQSKLDPDLIKMGDGQVRITINGKGEWLHLQHNIHVVFNPSSTEYEYKPGSNENVKLRMLVSQAGNWGAVIKLSCTNSSQEDIDLNAAMMFGGLRQCSRTISAAYFALSKEDSLPNSIDTLHEYSSIYSNQFPGKVFVSSMPRVKPCMMGNKVSYEHEMKIKAGESSDVYFILGQSFQSDDENEVVNKIILANPELLIREGEDYYLDMLNEYSISTPDTILNTGFKTAILNFDNIHADSAWLEGVHWWASYWTNNYQISSAISLGQLENARKALLLYNTDQYGPAPALMFSGKPFVDSVRQGAEDGIPYYLYSLIQYYNATGDVELVREVWPALRKSLFNFLALRDPDKNGLLNWHMGANAFLYQADHLGLPGDAASPSLMMAGMLERLSELANHIAEEKDAAEWKKLSEKMYANLKSLWNEQEGFFYSHKDLQGIKHTSLYYTDLVFPALYTSLPDQYSWQSLDYLYRTLWTNNYSGEKNLMRVGNLKPSIFGNDNVMPVQMAEAARAYFKQGDGEKGVKLMSSVALAATIFTESPGSFPERMSDEGKGEANYLFGNPIGSFIHATIIGLFGMSLDNKGNTLSWQPAFPTDWKNASIRLPYASATFKRSISTNDVVNLIYEMRHNKERELHFITFIEPGEISKITCNGKEVRYRLTPGSGRIKIAFEAEKGTRHNISIIYRAKRILFNASGLHYPNMPENAGKTIFITDESIRLKGSDEASEIELDKVRKENTVNIDISKQYNTNTVYAFTEWRNANVTIDSSYFTFISDDSKKQLSAFNIFTSNPNIAMINYGISDQYTRETKKSQLPEEITFQVNKECQQLNLLFINEMETRLTNAEVGNLILNYSDGSQTDIPLIVGKNVDALSGHFADQLKPVRMKETDYAKIYELPVNSIKELKSFTIKLKAADFELGLLGVNVVLPVNNN